MRPGISNSEGDVSKDRSLSHTLEQRAPLPAHCHCSGLPVLTLQQKKVLLSEVIETLGFGNLNS